MLGLELSCEGMLRREYPLLLPSAIARPQAQPEPGPPEPRRPNIPRWPSPHLPGCRPTLNELAQRLYPGDRNLRRRFVAAARRAHPDQFPNRASTSRPMADEAALDIAALRRQAETPPAATRAPRATAAPEHTTCRKRSKGQHRRTCREHRGGRHTTGIGAHPGRHGR